MNHSEMVMRDVPLDFLKASVDVVFRCYRQAYDHCLEFPEQIAKNVRPFYRRGLIERDWWTAAGTMPQVTGEIRNAPSSSWSHTFISAGDVGLTQNAIDDPERQLREAEFRKKYCGTNRQQFLFPMEPVDAEQKRCAYGVMIHGCHRKSPFVPSFIQIRFLKPSADEYYQNSLDLFEICGDVVASHFSHQAIEPTEIEIKAPEIRLKPKDRKDANEA